MDNIEKVWTNLKITSDILCRHLSNIDKCLERIPFYPNIVFFAALDFFTDVRYSISAYVKMTNFEILFSL